MNSTSMIWRLMKRDPTWIVLLVFFALLFLPMVLLEPRYHKPWMLLTFASIYLGATFGASFRPSCTHYEAALPISGRDLWLARLLLSLAFVWGPALILAVWMKIIGYPLLPLAELAAAVTVVHLAARCFWSRRHSVPWWFRVVYLAVPPLANGAVVGRWFAKIQPPWPPAGPTFAICGLASAAIFVWGWTTVPRSFQFVPAGVPASRPERNSRQLLRFTWSPAFRTVFRWPMWVTLGFLLASLSVGFGVFAFAFVAILLIWIQYPVRWLSSLPVSSRAVFGIVSFPLAAATMAGSLLRTFGDPEHPLSLQVRFIEAAAELAILFLLVLFSQFFAWRRLSRVEPWIRGIPVLSCIVAVPILLAVTVYIFNSPWGYDEAARTLAHALPQSGWLLAPIVIVPPALIFWLAERTFGEGEYPTAIRPMGLYP